VIDFWQAACDPKQPHEPKKEELLSRRTLTHRDPTVDRPSPGLFAVAIVIAAIAGFGWLQGENEHLVDEWFLVGSWVLSLNNVIGLSFKRGFAVNPRWRKSVHIRNFLIPLSVLATILYLVGNFILSPALIV